MMDEQLTSKKINSLKKSKVSLMCIKLSHKVNNVKRDLLTVTSYQHIR